MPIISVRQHTSVLLAACYNRTYKSKLQKFSFPQQVMTVVLSLAMLLPATEAFFDNLIELPMNMAGYMSVARASTECEDQVFFSRNSYEDQVFFSQKYYENQVFFSQKSYEDQVGRLAEFFLLKIFPGGDSSGCDH